jgi:hypothetical protein
LKLEAKASIKEDSMGRSSDASEGKEQKESSDIGSNGSEHSEGIEHRPGPKGLSESSSEGSEGSEVTESYTRFKMDMEVDVHDLYNRVTTVSPFHMFHF